jgi:5-methylcytosine-specific restriction endonuclease McrA
LQRSGIFDRDDYRCVYCGERFAADDLTIDHVQPRVRGGDHSGGNLVTACRACNTLKGHRRLSEFLYDNPVVRANFAQYAVYVWPRLMRLLDDELARLDARREKIR